MLECFSRVSRTSSKLSYPCAVSTSHTFSITRHGIKFVQVLDDVDMWYLCLVPTDIESATNNLLHGSINECRAHGATPSPTFRRSSDTWRPASVLNGIPLHTSISSARTRAGGFVMRQCSNFKCNPWHWPLLASFMTPEKHIKSWHKVVPSFRLYERLPACQNTVPSAGSCRLSRCVYGAKPSSIGRESPICLIFCR